MKIKDQFKWFILGITAVPLLCVTFIPVFHFFTRPERSLISGYKQIRQMTELPMTKRDMNVLREVLKTMPAEVEMIIIANHSEILYTNMKEFESFKTIDDPTLFYHIKETSQKFFYQVVSPPLEDSKKDVIVVSRIKRDNNHSRSNEDKLLLSLLIFIVMYEVFCITITVKISNTISKSIMLLEQNTQRIAGGELDVKLTSGKEVKTDNEITNLTENLDKMRLSLKDASERRTKFIMGISHDLRTPVAVIKGYVEAINDGIIDSEEEIHKTMEIIATKASQLETMINTLINFVKLNRTDWRQQLKFQNIEPSLTEFAKSCINTGEVFKRHVTSSINIDKDIKIPFDKELFQRCLENLFQNALRYTHENDSIIIKGNQTAEYIEVAVEDTGIGIETKDIGHIFDVFYRGTNSRKEAGMGIGLSVVKTIVDTHGWTIRVNSQKGVGTEFIIKIPLKDRT